MDLLQKEIHNALYLHDAVNSQPHLLVLGRTSCACWSSYWSFKELGLLPLYDIPVSLSMEML